MAINGKSSPEEIRLRRYPNRRYYDTTRSRYVTLQEIHGLILEGNDVQVTDAKTGEDITAKVLAQIILEHDSPKLQIFPIQLLHQLIRTNELLVRGFVESFFGNALLVFMESQRLFDRYLRLGLGPRRADDGGVQQTTPPSSAAPPEACDAVEENVLSPAEGGDKTVEEPIRTRSASGQSMRGPQASKTREDLENIANSKS